MPSPSPQRYLRSHDDRLLGGVAGGLGRAFGVDAVIFRILLAALVFAGGIGVLIYLAALVIVPADDGTGQPASRRGTWRKAAIGGAIVLGVLVGAAILLWGSAWATAAGGGVLVAIVVVALGVTLLAGAFRKDKRARWLVLPALLIALPATVVSAADVSLEGGVGERTYRPTGADPLPTGYRLGAGELVVDLRGLDWSAGRTTTLDLDVGVGSATVYVPESVCVGASTEVRVGYADVLGRYADGFDLDHDVARRPAADAPTLTLDVHVGMGSFEVLHRAPIGDERGPGRERDAGLDSGAETAARRDAGSIADRACAGAPA